MPYQINTDRIIHPFARGWSNVQKSLHQKKWKIISSTGWSERTFTNKIQDALDGKLKLKPEEIPIICKVLEISEEDILNYQKNQNKNHE